jgi:hypothetical protein
MIEMAIRPETIRLSIWIGYIDDISSFPRAVRLTFEE